MRDRSGVINAADPSLADRVAGSSAIRNHAHANAERAAAAVERAGPAKGFALSRWAGAPGRKRRGVEYAGETLRCGVLPRVEVIRLSQSCAPANSPLPLARNCCGPKFPAVDRSGAPDRIRTCDLCLRRAALYPLSYGCFSASRLGLLRARATLPRRGASWQALPPCPASPCCAGGGARGCELLEYPPAPGSAGNRQRGRGVAATPRSSAVLG